MAKQKKKVAKPPADETIAKRPRLVEFFANSPLAGSAIDLERKPDYGREIELGESE